MRVVKSLNNSLILSQTDDGSEVILMGKGIGFTLKKGDQVPEKAIEKTFVLSSEMEKKNYLQVFSSASEELLSVVQQIVAYSQEQLAYTLSKNLFFTLVDHLNYAIERQNQGIVFQNKLLVEVQRFYLSEYKIGVYGIQRVESLLGISLPLEEAGNIAFHLVNAQAETNKMDETIQSIRMLKDILAITSHSFPEKQLSVESTTYLRFVTHLQFFIRRMIDGEVLPAQNNFVLETLSEHNPKEFNVATKIKRYVEEELEQTVNKDELLYLTLHLSRVY